MVNIKYLGKFILAIIIAIFLLSVFTIFYRHTSLHVENITGATDYKAESNFISRNLQEGFAYVKMDSDGFNNAKKISTPVNILIMGSSHMEAIQVDQNLNTASILNNLIKNKKIYNIGVSGHTIYNCINNLKCAKEYYNPKDYIIIETDRIELSIDDMEKVIHNKFSDFELDGGVKYFLKKYVPFTKLFYIQMQQWRQSNEVPYIVRNTKYNYSNEKYLTTIDQFMSMAKDCLEFSNTNLIIVYHPETKITRNGKYYDSTNKQALETFEKSCKNNDIIFVNMSKEFEILYKKDNILAHGFSNTAVGKGHLNRYGHQLIAEKLSKIIEGKDKNYVIE